MNARELAELSALVRIETGIVLDASHSYAVGARLDELARAESHSGIAALLSAVQQRGDRELVRKICEAVTVHETRFFRDERTFRAIATKLVPSLLESGRRSISIWCGAIASGQEVYSVAMLMRDMFPTLPVRIIGTDLSRTMVEQARRGVYTEFEVSRGLTPAQRARHLVQTPDGWQIRPELLAKVELDVVNLAAPWPTWPHFDIVMLRNVLVYLDSSVRTAILARTRNVLADDGALILGATEVVPDGCSKFQRRLVEGAVMFTPVQEAA